MSRTESFLGRGWSFPVRLDPETHLFRQVAFEDDIKQSIRIILSTAKGERVMRPEFGCGIHDLVFDALSESVLGLVETSVADALRAFEPRIEVTALSIDRHAATEGRLDVGIEYRVHETNQSDNLVYPFYLKEAR